MGKETGAIVAKDSSGAVAPQGGYHMRILLKIAKVLLVLVGLVAILHGVCLRCQHPLVRLVEVEGNSMQPTFAPGDRVLFVRKHFEPGNVVLADAGDDGPVIKRVVDVADGHVHLVGDNSEHSAVYDLPRSAILGVYVGKVPLKLPCCKAR